MKKQIFTYVLFFIVNAILLNIILYFLFFQTPRKKENSVSIRGKLTDKIAFYKNHNKDYNLIFVGDSRTYTNINNYQIDTVLKTNSINMAMWGNWFPTQYCFLQDFLPLVPDSTTLVFSFGVMNFKYCKVYDSYPIEFNRALEYLNWGFSFTELKNALYYYNSNVLPIIPLSQPQIHEWLNEEMDNYFAVINAKKNTPTQNLEEPKKNETKTENNSKQSLTTPAETPQISKADRLETLYKKNPEVVTIFKKFEKDTVTSLEVYWKRGNYWRIEVDSLFFRRKQKENTYVPKPGESLLQSDFFVDERYWKNFEAIISLLKKNSKRLKIILNFVDEAPYTYWSGKKIFTNFITKRLTPYITSQGFTFITADVTDIPDSDYFDYNHMNNKGTVKYSEKLAKILKEKIN